MSTHHRMIVEFLLKEMGNNNNSSNNNDNNNGNNNNSSSESGGVGGVMGNSNSNSNNNNNSNSNNNNSSVCGREGYVFAAGVALGHVLLGAGATEAVAGMHCVVAVAVVGAAVVMAVVTVGVASCVVIVGWLVAVVVVVVIVAGVADLQVEQRLYAYMEGGKHYNNRNATTAASSLMSEGEYVNVSVTAPAAVVALGLMYMRSSNAAVASRLSVHLLTFRLLEQVMERVVRDICLPLTHAHIHSYSLIHIQACSFAHMQSLSCLSLPNHTYTLSHSLYSLICTYTYTHSFTQLTGTA